MVPGTLAAEEDCGGIEEDAILARDCSWLEEACCDWDWEGENGDDVELGSETLLEDAAGTDVEIGGSRRCIDLDGEERGRGGSW
jgi:hypothetical protein